MRPPTMEHHTLLEQGTGRLNEDCLVVRDNLLAVFDGATSLSPALYENGLTGGWLASHIAAQTLRESKAPLPDLVRRANSAVRVAMRERGVLLHVKENLWSTSLAAVRMQDDHFEWAQLGDATVLVILQDGTHEVLAGSMEHDRETLTMWQAVAHTATRPIGQTLIDQIRRVRATMNMDYGVLSGEPEAMNFLRHGHRTLHDLSDILIFTDGLTLPRPDPSVATDFTPLVDLYLTGGLQAVRDHIRAVEAADPFCRAYPRFKTHDDIAAVALPLLQPTQPVPAFGTAHLPSTAIPVSA